MLLVLSLAACGAPASDSDTATEGVTEVATEAPLSISGLNYSKSGAIKNFQIEGTIVSSEALDRIDYTIDMKSNDSDIHVTGNKESYLFAENITTMDMSELTDIIIDQYDILYNLYVNATGLVGVDDSLMATLNCTCYDAAGNTVDFTITYEIVSE